MRFRKLAGVIAGTVTAGLLVAPSLTSSAAADPADVSASAALTCAFGSFSFNYAANLTASVDGTAVTGTLANKFGPTGQPAFVTVSKMKYNVHAVIDGEQVDLVGEQPYSPAAPGTTAFSVPALSGTRTATAAPSAVSITGASITMTSGTSDSPITCGIPVGTSTALTAASPSAGKVNLSATVTPADAAGKVDFYEGATKVGSTPVTAGAAALSLTSVSAADHTYTAKFVPTSAAAFLTSTSGAATLTVGSDVAASAALTCAFGSFAFNYAANLAATVTGPAVTGTLANKFGPTGQPAFVTVSKLKYNVHTVIDGEQVDLVGEQSYSPAAPGTTAFDVPALSGTRTATAAPSAVSITGASITMTSGTSDSPITCGIPVGTSTALTAASPSAGKVNLSATVTPADAAGKVDFYEGTTKVGSTPVAAGAAALSLTSVSAADHTYTAKFVPTSAAAFSTSTSGAATLTVGSDVAASAALTCVFGSFAFNYAANLAATVTGPAVTGTLANKFGPTGQPAFVTVSKLKYNVHTVIDGEQVDLVGEQSYSPAAPGTTAFDVPALSGTRTATAAPSTVSITGATITMTALGGDNVVNCGIPVGTSTALTAASPSAGKVDLSATVTPADAAGKVDFYEGATKVGSTPVAAGAAALSLTSVSAADHTYTAKFVPTSAAAFSTSTSAAATVTVADPVVPAVVTTTTLTAASPSAGNVDLSATVTPADAVGKVDFYEGATKVGSTPVAAGAAALSLTSVSAADHTYTATFVPTDALAYETSTSGSKTVTVAAPNGSTQLTASQTLSCVFQTFGISYSADLAASVTGTAVTGTLSTKFVPGMPDFVTVSKLKMDLQTLIDGETVHLVGVESFDPAKPGSSQFDIPALAATRTASAAPASLQITGATITMTALGGDSIVTCVPGSIAPTTTTLTSTSPSAGTVNLSATVTPADAVGKVDFYEGTTKVGSTPVAAGAAALSLTGVSAGAHTYTAKFVPTSAGAFAASTSSASTVTVTAVVPTEACTKANADVKAWTAKVKAATTKVTRTRPRSRRTGPRSRRPRPTPRRPRPRPPRPRPRSSSRRPRRR